MSKSSEDSTNLKHSNFGYFLAGSLLWPRSVSLFAQYFFFWASNLQYLAIIIWGQLTFATTEKDDILSIALARITDFLTLHSILELDEAAKKLELIIWIYFFIIFCTLILIIVKFFFKEELSRLQSYWVFLITQFHLSITFWSINVILINHLYVENQHISSTEDETADHATIKAAHLVFIVMNYIMTFFLSIFSYDPFKASNHLSVHSPLSQVFDFVLKGGIAPIIAIDDKSSSYIWYFAVFSFVITTLKYLWVMYSFPYYNHLPMKMASIWTLMATLISGLSIIDLIIQEYEPVTRINMVYIQICSIPLLIKICQNRIRVIIIQTLAKSDHALKSQEEALKKLFALNFLKQNAKFTLDDVKSHNKSGLYLFGFLSPNYLSNNPSTIEISGEKDGKGEGDQKALIKLIDNMIYSILLEISRRTEANEKIKLILAEYMYEKNTNYSLAVIYLLEISKCNRLVRLVAGKLLRNFEKKIQEDYQNRGEGKINPKIFVDFNIISAHFLDMLNANSVKFLNFWETYKSPKLEIMDLFYKSRAIETNDENIKEYWAKIIEAKSLESGFLGNLYRIYLLLIRNAPFSAAKIQEKRKGQHLFLGAYDTKSTPLSLKDVSSLNSITFSVSMAKNKVGKILKASQNANRLLKLHQNDLIGKDINTLLMNFMRERHYQLMFKHVNMIRDVPGLHIKTENFIKGKEGDVVPCYIDVSLHPYIHDELTYICVVRLKNVEKEYLILDQNGFIEGYTRNIGRQLRISNKKINITDLCLSLEGMERTTIQGFLSTEKSQDLEREKKDPSQSSVKESLRKKLFGMAAFETDGKEERSFIIELYSLESFQQRKRSSKKAFKATISQSNTAGLRSYILTLEQPFDDFIENSCTDIEALRNSSYKTDSNPRYEHDDAELKSPNSEDDISAHIPDEKIRVIPRVETQQVFKLDPLSTDRRNLLTKETKTLPITDRRSVADLTLPEQDDLIIDTNINSKRNLQSLIKPRCLEIEVKENAKKDAEATRTSMMSSTSSSKADVEHAIYMLPKKSSTIILSILLIFLILITKILLILVRTQYNNTISLVGEYIELISASTIQLFTLVECNRLMRHFTFLDLGLFSMDRFAWANIPDVRFIVGNRLDFVNDEIKNQNNIIRNSVNLIEESLKSKVYQKIHAIDWDPFTEITTLRQTNLFDLSTDVLAAIQGILWTPYQDLTGKDRNVLFLANNTLNDLLFATEDLTRIAIQSNKQALENSSKFIGGNLAFTFFFQYDYYHIFDISGKRFYHRQEQIY